MGGSSRVPSVGSSIAELLTPAVSAPGNLLEMQILRLPPQTQPTRNYSGGTQIFILTNPPGGPEDVRI